MRIIHSLLVKSYCKFECGAVTATVDWFYTVFNVEYCNSVKVSIYIFFCFVFIHLLFSVSNWLSYILSMHAFSVSGRLTYVNFPSLSSSLSLAYFLSLNVLFLNVSHLCLWFSVSWVDCQSYFNRFLPFLSLTDFHPFYFLSVFYCLPLVLLDCSTFSVSF